MKKILITILIILIAIPLCVSAGQRIVVMANSIDYANSAEFVNYLDSKGRPVLHIAAKDLDAHNQEKFIVILGGPSAPEGIGPQVMPLISKKDVGFLNTPGNKRMFIKTNVWRKGQIVLIIAGNHRNNTKEAMSENQADVLSELTEDRSIALSQNTANINFEIVDYNYSYNSSSGYWFFHFVEYSMEHEDKDSLDPMIDVEIQRKEDSVYKQVFLNTNVTHFDEKFKAGDKWIDTHTESVKLKHGWHKIIVRLRDGADSTVIKEDVEEFLI